MKMCENERIQENRESVECLEMKRKRQCVCVLIF